LSVCRSVSHVPSFAQAFSSGSPWLRAFPPAWFVGLEQWLIGESQYSALALAALGALLVAGSIAGRRLHGAVPAFRLAS
jgi:hypothetical protein